MQITKEMTQYMKEFVIPRAQKYLNKANAKNAFASVILDMNKDEGWAEYLRNPTIGMVISVTMMEINEESIIKFVNGIPTIDEKWGLKPLQGGF